MKKIICFGLFMIILVAISMTFIGRIQSKDASSSLVSASSVSPNLSVTNDNNCHEIENFTKKLPRSEDENYIRYVVLKTLIKDNSFKKLEETSLNNNKCGAKAASYLANLYSYLGMSEKSNQYHQRVIQYASLNNFSAIENLCDGYDSLTTTEQKLHFCQIVIEDKKQIFGSGVKFAALYSLGSFYFTSAQGDKLFNLCEMSDSKDVCMVSYVFPFSVINFADKLNKGKQFEEAIELYKKVEPYDFTGVTQTQLAEMYQNGEGVRKDLYSAIDWYEKALKKNKNPKIRSMIINNLGTVYLEQLKYIDAFDCFRQSATMGNSLGQLNLGRMYILGHGTIQNNKEAYAWINIAIAQGLENEDKQSRAEKTKKWLVYALRGQDRNGVALKEAEDLAQLYYRRYILNEEPIKKPKSFIKKIQTAIEAFNN